MTPWVPTAVASYLLGSIPVGYLVVRAVKGIDVRTVGSGNIGMTNVWRTAGAGWGVTVLFLDIAKGVLAVLAPRFVWPTHPDLLALQVLAGLSVMVGNIFPLFLRFKGGKGVGTAIGIFFTLLPVPTAIAVVVFAAAVLATRMISVGSLTAAFAMAAATWVLRRPPDLLHAFALLAAVLVAWTHRSNIRRILEGTENRIGSAKRNDPRLREMQTRRKGRP